MTVDRREACLAIAGVAASSLTPTRAAAALDPTATAQSPAAAAPTLSQASRAIRNGSLTSVELVGSCLDRIASQNSKINAVITTMHETALAQAAALDVEARAGKFRSPLHGIPIALKDNIDTTDAPTTNASALLVKHIPAADARVVRSLKQAGAVIVAKTNMSEFALASATSATSHFGPVRNPWRPDHVSGGSSGGSAAAVAAGMALGALGTDSGGSVRIPAAWCGLTGLKPTRGLVPTTGVGPGIPIIDTTGPMARTVEDVALMLQGLAGYDPLDPVSIDRPREDYAAALTRPISALRIGVPRMPFFEELDAEVADAVERALGVLAKQVRSVRDVALNPGISLQDSAFLTGDIVTYHERFYPGQIGAYQPMIGAVVRSMFEDYNNAASGSTAQKIAHYVRSSTLLTQRQRTADALFDGFNVVVMPTMRELPPTVETAVAAEYGASPKMLGSKVNTMTFNMLGLPALSLPCGFSRSGLPIGLMIAGRRFSETTLLALGAAYQRATSWHESRPGAHG